MYRVCRRKHISNIKTLYEEFEKTAIENMKMAGKLEMQLAIKRNEIINNHPYITVIADGSWAKRSYDKDSAYDSLSGAGAIVG